MASEHGQWLVIKTPAGEESRSLTPIEYVEFHFDQEEARGVVRLTPGCYGLTVDINGRPAGLIDLFHLVADAEDDLAGVPQIVIDPLDNGDALAFVRYRRGYTTIDMDTDVVERHPELETPNTIVYGDQITYARRVCAECGGRLIITEWRQEDYGAVCESCGTGISHPR